MTVIKLVEDYAVSQLRKDVRDALMMAGEQSVLLQLYHAGDPDATACTQCGDDLYESPEVDCTSCYGTMFEGAVRSALKVWALYTDRQISEQLGPRGVYEPDHRSVQLEAFPMVTEHDVIVRVPQWAIDGSPAKLEGFYMLAQVDRRSLRTGNRAGQYNWDVVAQKAQIAELPESMGAITRYPILGTIFEESAQLIGATPRVPAHAVLQPDIKVVYFPFEAAPGGPVPESGGGTTAAFTFDQVVPASTWTIQHNLGYRPDVTIIVGEVEVETDIDYPNNNVVVLTFATPQAGQARLI